MRICEIYERADIRSLPANPAEAAELLGIKVVNYRTVCGIYEKTPRELFSSSRFGFSFKDEGIMIIALNENSCGERRRRFTAAHELGHCLLGHLERENIGCAAERAADEFAADFLEPLAVLNSCGVSSAAEISRLCAVSEQAAEIRFKELSAKRRAGNDFFDSDENIRIAKQFSRFIGAYVRERSMHKDYEEYLRRRIKILS